MKINQVLQYIGISLILISCSQRDDHQLDSIKYGSIKIEDGRKMFYIETNDASQLIQVHDSRSNGTISGLEVVNTTNHYNWIFAQKEPAILIIDQNDILHQIGIVVIGQKTYPAKLTQHGWLFTDENQSKFIFKVSYGPEGNRVIAFSH